MWADAPPNSRDALSSMHDFMADSSRFAADRPALPSSSLSVVTTWYLLCRLAGCCSGWSGLEEWSLWVIRLAVAFPLRLRVSSAAVGGSAWAGVAAPCYQLRQMDQLLESVGRGWGQVASWWGSWRRRQRQKEIDSKGIELRRYGIPLPPQCVGAAVPLSSVAGVGTSYVKTRRSGVIKFLCPTRDPCTNTENRRKS
ncbi:hypothetical protein V6N13_104729 [Hibiscus sabdariffa]